MTQPITTNSVSEGPEEKSSLRMGPKMGYAPAGSDRRWRVRPDSASDALRVFRQQTHGLSQRLPLRSVESMRAGKVRCPHAMAHEYLAACRRAGLPRTVGAEFVTFVAGLVEAMWAGERTPERYALVKEQEAENAGNLAELAYLANPCADTRRTLMDHLRREVAAETALLAVLDRAAEHPLG
ncbi:MAG TPA: hypothetical protein VFS11_10300 [Gemmatimonadales bacterium]|nr:hypothetical protein [Gemmatimonadales bacterium]